MNTSKVPSVSLYVGDLHPEVTETSLYETFSKVGPVASIRVCRDSYDHRSLGYAYVNFLNPSDADIALNTLNNSLIHGRPCRIMWSQRDPTLRKSGVGNIFIKSLADSIDHKALYDTFSKFGNILSCKVATDETGKSKGFGFVHFADEISATNAISQVNNMILAGKKVFVGPFLPRRERIKQREASWTNVYVKNLDLSVDEAKLKEIFREYGPITSVAFGQDPQTTKDTKFGFVNFERHEDACKAVTALQNKEILSKPLWCGRHQKKSERKVEKERNFFKLKQKHIAESQGSNLYIKNLEDEIDDHRLYREFSRFGTIKSYTVMKNKDKTSKGFGFVNFSTPDEASNAIRSMHDVVLQGCHKRLYVNYHEPREIRRAKLAQIFAKRAHRGGHMPPPPYYTNGVPPSNYMYPVGMRRPAWPQYPAAPYPVPVPTVPPTRGTNRGMHRGGRGGIPAQSRKQEEPSNTLPDDQKKLFLGEQLYPLIYAIDPEQAGKITGMLLDSGWSAEQLVQLIQNPELLSAKVAEAIEVLQLAKENERS